MDENRIRVTDEAGNEKEYEIVHTFASEQTGKSYVVFKEPDDESGEVYAMIYEESAEEDGGTLTPIETDEEWNLIEVELERFAEEEPTEQ